MPRCAIGGAEEEHATTEDAVCAIEPVDAAPSMASSTWINAPEKRVQAATAAQTV